MPILKRKLFAAMITDLYPHPQISDIEKDIDIATKWMIELQRAERRSVQLIMGKDGRRYELRKAEQRDLSIIHHDDPAMSWNDGWLRHFSDNEWTGYMVRPADPAVRQQHLIDRMAAIEAKGLLTAPQTPLGAPELPADTDLTAYTEHFLGSNPSINQPGV
jgi:hypothetical protein